MGLQEELQDIIEALSGEAGVTPPSGTEDQLKWYLDDIEAILREGGGSGVETFVREYNGEIGIGVSVDASGNPPSITGSDGDYYFTLAFNSVAVEEIPEGWIIIAWEWVAGMWEFSSALLPIAAKDLHWVAIKNGTDIDGYYVILTGNTAADLPQWELLGAAAVVPDGVTIDYNMAGKLAARGYSYSRDEKDTGKVWHDGKPIYRRVFTGNIVAEANVSVQTPLILGVGCLVDQGGYIQTVQGVKICLPHYFDDNSWYKNPSIIRGNAYLDIVNDTLFLESCVSTERVGTTDNGYEIWAEYTKL
jgi:hypothetical protein